MRTESSVPTTVVGPPPATGTLAADADADAAAPAVAAAADAEPDAEAAASPAGPRALRDADHRDLLGAAARLDGPAQAGELAADRGGDLVEFEAARVGRIGRLDRDRAARDRLAEVEAGDRRRRATAAAAHVHRAAGEESEAAKGAQMRCDLCSWPTSFLARPRRRDCIGCVTSLTAFLLHRTAREQE